MRKEFMLVILLILARAYADTPLDIDSPDVDGGGSAGPSPISVPNDITSMLEIRAAVWCYDPERYNTETENTMQAPFFERKVFHDGTSLPTDPPYYEYLDLTFDDYASWASEPSLAISDIDMTTQQMVKYEGRTLVPGDGGGCMGYGQVIHRRFEAGTETNVFNTEWQPTGDFYHIIDWDDNQAQCEALGGNWTDAAGFDNFSCCGDDWIWVNNYPLNYAPLANFHPREDNDNLCLYSRIKGITDPAFQYGFGASGEPYGMGTDSWFCEPFGSPENFHSDYDGRLGWDSDAGQIDIHEDYYFLGTGTTETDLGKWTSLDGSTVQVCTVDFDNTNGVSFAWEDLQTATDNQFYCEILGYNWTGTNCCGVPENTDSYSDTTPECRAEDIISQIASSEGIVPSHIAYRSLFEQKCQDAVDDGHYQNNACYLDQVLEKDSARASDPAHPEIRNLFNDEGEILVCGDAAVETFSKVDRCELRGDLGICTHINDSWIVLDETDTKSNELGYIPNIDDIFPTRARLEASVNPSSVPEPVKPFVDYDTECCISDTCWNGQRCVGGASGLAQYQFLDDVWEEFNQQQVNPDKEVYACQNGSWGEPLEPKFDWYHDEEHPNYCPEAWMCACSDDDGEPDCGAYASSGCTMEENFFIADHMCEDGKWISRTKVLATQMLEIAQGDYTLFCDSYINVLNNIGVTGSAEDNINNLCVLNHSAGVVLGVTFKSDDPQLLDVDKVLFDQNSGFVNQVLGVVMNYCEAESNPDTSVHGSFQKCNSADSRVWYNNKMQALIFAKNGLSITGTTSSAYSSNRNTLESMYANIVSEIQSEGTTMDGAQYPFITNIGVFENANSYARIYMADVGSAKTFGIIEKLHSPGRGPRNYMGVYYQGISNEICDPVEQSVTGAYCGDDVVIQMQMGDDFEYWRDLTAKLRFRG